MAPHGQHLVHDDRPKDRDRVVPRNSAVMRHALA